MVIFSHVQSCLEMNQGEVKTDQKALLKQDPQTTLLSTFPASPGSLRPD